MPPKRTYSRANMSFKDDKGKTQKAKKHTRDDHRQPFGGPISIPDDLRDEAIDLEMQDAGEETGSFMVGVKEAAAGGKGKKKTSVAPSALVKKGVDKKGFGSLTHRTLASVAPTDEMKIADLLNPLFTGDEARVELARRIKLMPTWEEKNGVVAIPLPQRNILRKPLKSKEAQLFHLNQQNSPLLRLPAGIRNTIYEYILGGNTILIIFTTYHNEYISDDQHISRPVFKYHSQTFDSLTCDPFETRLDLLRANWCQGYTPLNNICRQLYLETAVLPYELNTWAFDNHGILWNFVVVEKRLSDTQRNAIRELVMQYDIPGDNVLGFMGGVEEVVVTQGTQHRGVYKVVRNVNGRARAQKVGVAVRRGG